MPKKYVGKSQESGASLMWGASQPPLRVGVILCPSRRPDQIWMKLCGQLQLIPRQKSDSIVRKPGSFFIPFKYHPQSIPESNQVSLLHECQLLFLWNVLPGLDESIHGSQPRDTASENHT